MGITGNRDQVSSHVYRQITLVLDEVTFAFVMSHDRKSYLLHRTQKPGEVSEMTADAVTVSERAERSPGSWKLCHAGEGEGLSVPIFTHRIIGEQAQNLTLKVQLISVRSHDVA